MTATALKTLGQAAHELNYSPGYLRKLERDGLIPPAARLGDGHDGGTRVYDEAAIGRIRDLLRQRREERGLP